MLITTVEITDYKRVRKVAITPDADRHVILIGGKNAQGKSSTLDALTAAFGGAKQLAIDPVRHGADEAAIYIELDGGKLTIERIIAPDGKTKLEVRDELGAVKSPQSVLDKLVGARFLDPLAFLALPAKEQRAQLMKLIDGAERIVGLNDKKERAFTRRTEVGRELAKAEGELARLPDVKPGEPLDVAALTAHARELAEMQRAGDGLGMTYKAAQREAEITRQELERSGRVIEDLARQLAAERDVHARLVASAEKAEHLAGEAKGKLEAAAARWTELLPEREKVEAELARASEHNRAIGAHEAQAQRRKDVAAEVEKLGRERTDLTAVIEKIDARKAEILAAAKLPVDGLSIGDDGIELAGVPFTQASGSERLRVALALAIAAAPGLNDVWIRDGALLDDEALEQVATHAAAAGKRVWIERVGTKDAGVIVIRDGEVVS